MVNTDDNDELMLLAESSPNDNEENGLMSKVKQ